MNAVGTASGIIVTGGIVALAMLFAWKGDSQHAMYCVLALLPAAGGTAAQVASKITLPLASVANDRPKPPEPPGAA